MLDNDVFTCAYYVLLSSIAGLHWMHAGMIFQRDVCFTCVA